MKIASIFANQLYAFHFENEEYNEFDKLFELWGNPLFVYDFVKQNIKDVKEDISIETLVEQIADDTFELEDIFNRYFIKNKNLDELFKPLNNQEYKVIELSKQKTRQNYLRVYALRIDKNCFVITGGAIKLTHLMKDRPHTAVELNKIEKCRNYLKENSVIDSDTFYELIHDMQ